MIEKNFYEEKLQEIKTLISNNELNEAMKLIKVELSMAYIPLKYENIFVGLFNEIIALKKTNSVNFKPINSESFLNILSTQDPMKIAFALDSMQELNLHKIAFDLKKWIENNQNHNRVIKIYMLEALSEQHVDINIKFENSIINPAKFGSIFTQPGIIKGFKLIESSTHQKPFLTKLVMQNFKAYIMLHYPIVKISDKEINSLIKITQFMLGQNVKLSKQEQKLLDNIKTMNQ